MSMSRRDFIRALAAARVTPWTAVLTACGSSSAPAPPADSAPPLDADAAAVFPQSVASADPTPSGVLLWTRVEPTVQHPDAALRFRIYAAAEDSDPLFEGAVSASELRADNDYTVRIDTDGLLAPDGEYFYDFVYRGVASRRGRLRTLPEPDAEVVRLRIGVAVCQAYHRGYYAGYERLAEEQVDFLIHLGDLIYEDGAESDLEGRSFTLPSGNPKAFTLEDFRYIHRRYRSDPHFQHALESTTLIATWDDHEIANNFGWDYTIGGPVAPGHPVVGEDPALTEELVRNGLQAWWEWVPARVRYERGAADLQSSFRLYRGFRFGRLADLVVTDERWYRSGLPCESTDADISTCVPHDDPARSMLGETQRDWFLDQVTRSQATWKLWASSLIFVPIPTDQDAIDSFQTDNWGAFPAERQRIVDALAAAGVQNFITLSGDRHASLAGYIPIRYEGYGTTASADNRAGIEFMATPMTSGSRVHLLGPLDPGFEATLIEYFSRIGIAGYLRWYDAYYNGYTVLDLAPEALTVDYVAVNRNDPSGQAPAQLFHRFRVAAGTTHIEDCNPLGAFGETLNLPQQCRG